MVDHDDDNIDTATAGTDHGHPAPAADPVLIALQLCAIANNKTTAAAIRKLCKLDRQYADIQTKIAALAAQAEQRNAELVQREAALAEREHALDARTTEFERSLQEARDNLAEYYRHVEQEDKRLRYRVMAHADLLSNYHPTLQDLPTWPQIRRLVAGLPDDPPPPEREVVSHPRIDASDTFFDPHADRHGAPFLGTLTRDVSHKAAQ
jgi:hypothetical protein